MINVKTIINSLFNSCTYILFSGNEVWIIDCGDSAPIIEFLKQHQLELHGILITHSHFDHIYGINDLVKCFPTAKIFASEESLKMLFDDSLNLSCYHDSSFVVEYPDNCVELSNGTSLIVCGCPLSIIPSEGHDLGCLSYWIDNCLFTGDAYIPGVPVFTKWQWSNKRHAMVTESKLKGIAEQHNLRLYPGHVLL